MVNSALFIVQFHLNAYFVQTELKKGGSKRLEGGKSSIEEGGAIEVGSPGFAESQSPSTTKTVFTALHAFQAKS